MRLAGASAALLVLSFAASAQVPVTQPDACLKVRTAALRLDAIAATIEACTSVIADQSQSRRIHADAFAQRGILYARRWRLTDTSADAQLAIADISRALDFRLLGNGQIHQLLIWRGALHEATRQPALASDDYRAVLRIAPLDETARSALRRLDAPTN